MFAYVLTVLLIILFMLQFAWMGMFALDVFFDTSLTTVLERARAIVRYLAYLFAIQALLFGVLLWLLYHGKFNLY